MSCCHLPCSFVRVVQDMRIRHLNTRGQNRGCQRFVFAYTMGRRIVGRLEFDNCPSAHKCCGCALVSLRCQHRHASHSVIPMAVKFGGCSPPLMWECNTGPRFTGITKCTADDSNQHPWRVILFFEAHIIWTIFPKMIPQGCLLRGGLLGYRKPW